MRTLPGWPVLAALLESPLPANPILGLLAHYHATDEVPAVLSPAGGTPHLTISSFTKDIEPLRRSPTTP